MATIATLTIDVVTRTGRFRRGLTTIFGGLTALGAAAGLAFKAFEDSEKVTKQTAAVLKSTGGAAKVSAGHVEDLATAIMNKTGIDDEAIRSGENLLLTFTKIRNEVGRGNDIFDQATGAITDMSAALGQDMKSSAIQVGKALQDPILGITALRRVGVAFTKEQAEMVARWVEQGDILRAQKFILAELATEFGGSAEAQKTASQTMATALGELGEVAGELLAPAVTALLENLIEFAGFLQKNLGPALAATGRWFSHVWDVIGPVVRRIGTELVEALQQAWDQIQTNVIPALKRLWQEGQPLWRLFGQIAAIVFKVAVEVFPWLFKALGMAIDHFALIVGAISNVIEWIKKLIGWVKDRLVAAWQAIEGPVMGVINTISAAVGFLVGLVQDAVDAIRFLASLNPLGRETFEPGVIGRGVSPRAAGGPVSAGHAYVVGERGPELFVPGSSGAIASGGGAQVINLYIGEDKVDTVVVKALRREAARVRSV